MVVALLQFESQCIKISHCNIFPVLIAHAHPQFNSAHSVMNLKDAQPCIALKKQLNFPRLQKRFYIIYCEILHIIKLTVV